MSNNLGSNTVADHTSWLGKNGQHVHAVVAHFRQLPDRVLYFSLETWCGGNHWLAHEHSPKPEYPREDTVTCRKCLKKIRQRAEAKA